MTLDSSAPHATNFDLQNFHSLIVGRKASAEELGFTQALAGAPVSMILNPYAPHASNYDLQNLYSLIAGHKASAEELGFTQALAGA